MTLSRLTRAAAAVACTALLAACQTAPPVAWKLPEGVQTLRVNGYPMAYTEAGKGDTVVLVHGAMCDYRCWAGTQRALADGFRVVTVSLRHFHPEPWDGRGTTFGAAQHASDLAAFLGRMNPPVRLVGHSYGGLVAAEVARTHPQLVSKLVLAEAGTDSLLPQPTEEQIAGRKRFAERVAATMRSEGTEAGLVLAVDTLNGPGTFSRYPPAIQAFHRDNAWTIVGAASDTPPRTSCADFGTLRMPVLLVTGENTAPRYKAIVAAQARCLPQAQTLTVPGVGHAVMANPAVLEPALKQFLR